MLKQTRTVLVLDDNEAVRESLLDYFEDRGWRVVPAVTAEEALEVVPCLEPKGAVVDIRLPGMDGAEFIRTVSKTHPRLACVICTGSPQYRLPHDVLTLPQVCKQVFVKPVVRLVEMEEALIRQILRCAKKEISHE